MDARPENDEYSREAHFVSDDWPTEATFARTARSNRQSRRLYFLHYARYVSLCINVIESPVAFVDVKLSFQGNSDIQTSFLSQSLLSQISHPSFKKSTSGFSSSLHLRCFDGFQKSDRPQRSYITILGSILIQSRSDR